jgi:hypothetical protein
VSLSEASKRTFINRRNVVCDGYQRDDGLLEIDAQLLDVRGFESINPWRGTVRPGDPIHRMLVRVTFDTDMVIRDVEVVTTNAPFPACQEVPPNFQRLVGLKITRGFVREARARIGGSQGCTHLLAMLDVIAATAMQTLATSVRGEERRNVFPPVPGADPSRPPLIDTCHGYASDGPVVEKLWPLHFRPRSE